MNLFSFFWQEDTASIMRPLTKMVAKLEAHVERTRTSAHKAEIEAAQALQRRDAHFVEMKFAEAAKMRLEQIVGGGA